MKDHTEVALLFTVYIRDGPFFWEVVKKCFQDVEIFSGQKGGQKNFSGFFQTFLVHEFFLFCFPCSIFAFAPPPSLF
jgi:hypothetical protein